MSTFSVPVVPIRGIEPIPNADAIELAVVGDYRSVVRKGTFSAGDLCVYIPEGAIVPDWLLVRMGLWRDDLSKGALDGSAGNRVKARRLRGCLSQGLVLGLEKAA